MFRGEDLKSTKSGSKEWLRMFQLMSSEFARMEGCPESSHVPGHEERVKEIMDLDGKLQAADTLDNLSNAVKWTEISVAGPRRPSYYLISYDNKSNKVTVTPYFSSRPAVASARCQARRSGSMSASVALASARWTRWRSSGDAAPYTAERTSG